MNILESYPNLKNIAIFKEADDESICKYIADDKFYFKNFMPDDEIFSPETQDVPVGIIISGSAKIISADDQKHVLLRTIGGGAIFGISTLYSSDNPFPTKIYTKQKTEVLFILPSALCSLIENDRGAMRGYMTFLNKKIVYLNKKITAFTAGSAERRLSLFLADNEADGVYYADISMSALADMLDIGRASLYRALEALENAGFIIRQDKTIVIKEKDALLKKYLH